MPDTEGLLTYHGRTGATLRVTVLDSKHTVGSLAKATGYSKSHISRIFRKLEGPSDECLKKLARALRMKTSDLASLLLKPRRAHVDTAAED